MVAIFTVVSVLKKCRPTFLRNMKQCSEVHNIIKKIGDFFPVLVTLSAQEILN